MTGKKSNREKLREITASIEQGIKELFQSDKYAEYLRTMSKFHSYSVRNTVLIHMQRPDATHVAGFNAWKNKFQRHVKKGEKGITILAPTPFKKKIEEKKLDPVTKSPMLDHDGNVIMEEKEVEIPLFRPVKVFDVSQTEGKPLPHLSSPLTGDVRNYEAFIEALRRTSPVPIHFQAMPEDTDGVFYQQSQRIAIREGMSQVQTVCAVVHEITHSLLHNQEQDRLTAAAGVEGTKAVKKDRNTEEVEAESVSYAVCQYYGIQTGENSFGYIATWSKDRELPELKASLETIGRTANRLINDIDRHFREICKERGIDLTQAEQTGPEAGQPDSAERFAADLYDFMDRLYQEGTIEHPYTLDSREQFIEDIIMELENNYFREIRSPLESVIERTGTDEAKALLLRLDQFETEARQPELSEPEAPVEPQEDTVPEEPLVEPPPDVLPEPLEQADTSLDEYPMPDTGISADALEVNCGYMDGDLLPLSKNRAAELLERDLTIYAVIGNGQAEMVFDRADMDDQPSGMMFGVSKEEWEASPDFHQLIADRLDHQEEREKAFLEHGGDCFAIYQLRHDDSTRYLVYEPLERIRKAGESPRKGNYELAYTGELAFGQDLNVLDKLWEKFNINHPVDYHRPSMSISDIVALKQDGVVSCYYVDRLGFSALPGFFQPENYLKNAEMAMEDDLGMIDGIINNGPKEPTVAQLEQQARSGQPISLMDLAAATHREEQEKKRSVREKLKNQPKPEQKRTAPKRSAERDR